MVPSRIKLPPFLAGIVFLLMLVLLSGVALTTHRHGFSVDGRIWFLMLADIAALVMVGVALIRRRGTTPIMTDEEKAGTKFGLVLIVLIVAMPVLGYFHAKLGF